MHLIYRKPAHNAVTAERALVNLNLVDYKKSQKNFFPNANAATTWIQTQI